MNEQWTAINLYTIKYRSERVKLEDKGQEITVKK